jgi:hypothetical protein
MNTLPAMTSPIRNRIKGAFIPVADIHAARDWYARVFGFDVGPVLHGHLCCIETEGPTLILDAKPRTAQGEVPVFRAPAVMLDTDDTRAAYDHLRQQSVRLLTEIQHDHFFNLADPDGNVLMVCGPNPRPVESGGAANSVAREPKVGVVEHEEMKLIGIPCVGLDDAPDKHRCARNGLLAATKHLPGVKNRQVHVELWPTAPTQANADTHAFIECCEVDSFDGLPDWFLKVTLPPQRCVVAAGFEASRAGFAEASAAVNQYLADHGLSTDESGRAYVICEVYDLAGNTLARYSPPLRGAAAG